MAVQIDASPSVLVDSLVPDIDYIRTCTDPAWLVDELRKATQTSVKHVARMAAIIRQLEELGHEVQVDLGPLPFLRKIAYGNMIPELYVALECDPALLSRAGSLPTPDQDRIARNEPMKVMELDGDHRMVAPLSMTRQEIAQVFAKGRLRDEAQQIGWLKDRARREQSKLLIDHQTSVAIDRKRRGIVANGVFIPAADLAHYLGELSRLK